MTEQLHFHFSLSCIGEGNGNPLQGSCLENPRNEGDWWGAVYGVTQSWTRLKRLTAAATYCGMLLIFFKDCLHMSLTGNNIVLKQSTIHGWIYCFKFSVIQWYFNDPFI